VQFDAAPALDHSSAVAAIAEAYAPVSRDKAIAEQEKREAAAAAAKAAQAAAAAKRQRDAAINQVIVASIFFFFLSPWPRSHSAVCMFLSFSFLTRVVQAQSKLEGVLSGIGGDDGGEPLEWELPSEEEEEEEAQPSELRSTEEWKQYVATYGQSYTERYFASYYHSQVSFVPPSLPPPRQSGKPCCDLVSLTLVSDAARVWRCCSLGLPEAERSPHRSSAVIFL
jgi:hypothetical protein